MTLFTENPLEKMMVQRPTGRRDSAPPVPKSPACMRCPYKAQSPCIDEELILDRETMEAKKKLGSQFAQVVYEGKWYTPLREAIQAFVESTQKYVTGEVKFKLYKGNIIKNGTTSPYSLYNESLASFTTGDMMLLTLLRQNGSR